LIEESDVLLVIGDVRHINYLKYKLQKSSLWKTTILSYLDMVKTANR
jgi:hypothetical protein